VITNYDAAAAEGQVPQRRVKVPDFYLAVESLAECDLSSIPKDRTEVEAEPNANSDEYNDKE